VKGIRQGHIKLQAIPKLKPIEVRHGPVQQTNSTIAEGIVVHALHTQPPIPPTNIKAPDKAQVMAVSSGQGASPKPSKNTPNIASTISPSPQVQRGIERSIKPHAPIKPRTPIAVIPKPINPTIIEATVTAPKPQNGIRANSITHLLLPLEQVDIQLHNPRLEMLKVHILNHLEVNTYLSDSKCKLVFLYIRRIFQALNTHIQT
jgi:hypothetical protein